MRRSFHARRGDGIPGLAVPAGMTDTRRMADLALIPWAEAAPPAEATLRARHAPHAHDRDESIWVVDGEITFAAAGRTFRLGPGDRLVLPAGTVHTAEAGPAGATYLVGEAR